MLLFYFQVKAKLWRPEIALIHQICFAVCAALTDKSHRKNFTPFLKKPYELCCDSKVDAGKSWAPQFICLTCAYNLCGWTRKAKKKNHMAFGVLVIWRESSSHTTDCYFCLANVTGLSYKTRVSVKYPDVLSDSKPVPHDPVSCPLPIAPTEYTIEEETKEESFLSSSSNVSDPDYQSREDIHLINNADLSDLVRDLALTKGQAEFLGSHLKEFHFLAPGRTTSHFRNRHKELVKFFVMSDTVCYCSDVEGLMSSLGVEHNTEAWRLFIDSSKTILKADHCWTLQCNIPNAQHKRNSTTKNFKPNTP